jgi:hypothetical protein
MEMITAEILAAYDSTSLQPDARSILSNILMQADYVKFAKVIPLRNENELNLTYSRQFIDMTKLIPVTPESKLTDTETLQTPDAELKL